MKNQTIYTDYIIHIFPCHVPQQYNRVKHLQAVGITSHVEVLKFHRKIYMSYMLHTLSTRELWCYGINAQIPKTSVY